MSLDNDAQEALRLHNEARDEIQEDPRPHLKWDSSLAADALQYAKKLAQRNSGLKHSSNHDRTRNGQTQGENLAWYSERRFGHTEATRLWIEEKFKYRGEKIGSGRDGIWAHYTEIIWPTVTKVGLALAHSRSGSTFVVARYDTCQLFGQTPYKSSLGNIFKHRTWRPIGRGSSSTTDSERQPPAPRAAHQPPEQNHGRHKNGGGGRKRGDH